VPFFVDTKRINIVETKLSYSNVIPYALAKENLFISSNLHIFYVKDQRRRPEGGGEGK
jgi:hypothetical protein